MYKGIFTTFWWTREKAKHYWNEINMFIQNKKIYKDQTIQTRDIFVRADGQRLGEFAWYFVFVYDNIY